MQSILLVKQVNIYKIKCLSNFSGSALHVQKIKCVVNILKLLHRIRLDSALIMNDIV